MRRDSGVAKEVERMGHTPLTDVSTVEGVAISSHKDGELRGAIGIIPFRVMTLDRHNHGEKDKAEECSQAIHNERNNEGCQICILKWSVVAPLWQH